MKSLVLLISILFVCGAYADEDGTLYLGRKKNSAKPVEKPKTPLKLQSRTTPKVQPKLQVNEIKKIPEQYNLIFFYSSADELEYEGTIVNLPFTETDKTDPSFGIGVNYTKMQPSGLGLEVGATYDFKRTFKSYKANVAGINVQGTYQDQPSLSVLYIYINGNYLFTNGVYLYAGVGYPTLNMKVDNAKISGDLGTQFGMGYKIDSKYTLDFGARFLKANGAYNDGTYVGDIDDVRLEGIILSLRYDFKK